MNMLEINDLYKSYGEKEVLKGISFVVEKGEIFALLGTNGAGKTTTLESIESLRKYDKGTITIHGSIGVQLQSSSLPNHIKVMEVMHLFSKWKQVETNIELMKHLGLQDLFQKKYKELSTGQKRRLHLAMALIGNPDMIFLDEPTAGLDVEGRVALHDEIRKLKESGKTLLMASHDMAEVEELCDRIGILKDGKLVFCGSVSELKKQVQERYRICIKTNKDVDSYFLQNENYIGKEKDEYEFEYTSLQIGLEEILQTLKNNNIALLDVRIEQATLEQRFMDIAKEV